MPPNIQKILLTGSPGCGKTTAIMKIVRALDPAKIAGFCTEEIRVDNVRKGFRFNCLDGRTGILAHVNVKSPFKVGKYAVDVTAFENGVLSSIDISRPGVELFVIDEIGKMECFSTKFIASVRKLLNSEKSVLAAVAQKGFGFIEQVKNYPGIRLSNLTARNRDSIVAEIIRILTQP